MTVWYTSDPHINHKLVSKIRFKQEYPSMGETFEGEEWPAEAVALAVKWHNEALAKNWDTTVGKDDVVYILGDLAVSGSKTAVNFVLDWITERPGRKILIYGNHDPVHPMNREAYKWQKLYLAHAFDGVDLAARRKFTLKDATTRDVLLSHMPYKGDRGQEDRDTQWRLRDEGLWLLHGHLHGDTALHTPGTKQIDVGLDPWKLHLVAQETLIGVIEEVEGVKAA